MASGSPLRGHDITSARNCQYSPLFCIGMLLAVALMANLGQ
jgi:hypothetical protein